jgi:hypothetical protein
MGEFDGIYTRMGAKDDIAAALSLITPSCSQWRHPTRDPLNCWRCAAFGAPQALQCNCAILCHGVHALCHVPDASRNFNSVSAIQKSARCSHICFTSDTKRVVKVPKVYSTVQYSTVRSLETEKLS